MPLWVNKMRHQATKTAKMNILFQGTLWPFLELVGQPGVILDGLFDVNLMLIEVI